MAQEDGSSSTSTPSTSTLSPDPPKRRRAAAPAAGDLLRKPVNTLAIVPKSTRITSLARKSYNVLLHEAQTQGLDRDVFRAPLDRIIKGVAFDSNDHALVKKHLRAMVSTTVEWQSPTSGEGTAWNVSGLLAHARLMKERGQVWVEWSYAINLKQELLEPTVFARLRLEIISQLRSHAGIALYEICTRYKDIGRTARQEWRWWRPVLSGQPENERTARLEYRIFKRDTLKPAIAEVSAITDIEVELVEHRDGRFIGDIQFLVRPKRQAAPTLAERPMPVDLSLVTAAQSLGVDGDKVEDLVTEFGGEVVRTALESLARRVATAYPEPLRDPSRYLRSLMPGEAAKAERQAAEQERRAADGAQEARESQVKRQARWRDEWIRRRRESIVQEIAAMAPERQAEMVEHLLADMEARNVHPSIRKRLRTSGWQHPMALHEMVRYYAAGAWGEHWDQPSSEQLLEIAAELGDA